MLLCSGQLRRARFGKCQESDKEGKNGIIIYFRVFGLASADHSDCRDGLAATLDSGSQPIIIYAQVNAQTGENAELGKQRNTRTKRKEKS
jgi:hypothetical protein